MALYRGVFFPSDGRPVGARFHQDFAASIERNGAFTRNGGVTSRVLSRRSFVP